MTGAGNGQRTTVLTAAGCLASGGHTLGCVACGARADMAGQSDVVADLRSRLACVMEASYWDRPYDERIAAIRGMCDLDTNGMTPEPEGRQEAIDRLRAWMPVDWSSEVITGQVRADLLLVLGLTEED